MTQATLDRVREQVLDGTSFHYKAQSLRSIPLGGGPTTHREYAGVLTAMANFARTGDWGAHVADKVLKRLNQYLTPGEMAAQVAEVLGQVVREGWFDVRGATGPEPGRRKDHQKPTTLYQALLLEVLFAEATWNVYLGTTPGIGWAVADLLKTENVIVYETYFPNVAKQLRDR